MDNNNFWNGKTVLLTGVSGFIGSWMAVWILEHGGKIIGISRRESSPFSNYALCRLEEKVTLEKGDIKDREFLQNACKKHQPEIVLHLAGQAIVGCSEEDTLSTNILGTLNVLECVKESESIKVCLFVTSSKCYGENNCWDTSYSKSKGCADLLIDVYRNTFFAKENYKMHGTAIVNFMLDNVVGGGDWGKNRLVPDCIRAIEDNKAISLRTPNAVTYWSSIFDVVQGISNCVENAFQVYNETEKICKLERKQENYKTAGELAELVAGYYKKELTEYKDSLEHTLRLAVGWYKNYRTENIYELCRKQLAEYMME